ncbi:cytotoxic and regulatory T-cell molecule [Lonchura striata]
MAVPGVLLAVSLLLLPGGFPGAASDSVTLREGENLNLHCSFSTPSNKNFTLQWSNPQGFTIFLNTHQVLRDQRYKLLRYSKDELSIQLSNLTVQDAGIYSCFYYRGHVQNKSRNVEILAAPSHPVLEVSQDEGGGIKLSCYTHGGRPQPQISWLLDNGIELPGDTRHQLAADGKKWSTRSTLRILSYSPQVTASCVTQHPALGARRLVASLHFQDLPSTGCKQETRLSEDAEVASTSENPAVSSSPEKPAVSSPSASPDNPEVSSPSTSLKNPEVSSPSVSPKDTEVSSPSPSPENPEVSNSSASPENPEISNSPASPENPEVSSPSASPDDPGVSNSSAFPENPAVPSSAPPPAQPNLTDVASSDPHPRSPGRPRPQGRLLLPALVAALVAALLLVVLLFLLKLRKAHGAWRRENDVSEQTLESYKSRSNEDSPGHEKNGQAGNPKSNMQYVTERPAEPPEKNAEIPEKDPETPEKDSGDKSTARTEETFPCGRESDV